MESNSEEKKNLPDMKRLSLTVDDIDAIECYRHFTAEQKMQLIELVYEISSVLYKIYFENNES